MMTCKKIRDKFLQFFKERGHMIIPSASLIPEKDPTTLFTGSGMQPLIPYILGAPHPLGPRLANSQKCFRAEDIDQVGDNRHTTFFEMLGNWSFGDYFKEEQLNYFFSFLIDELKLDPRRLYATVFAGDEKNNLPKDTESASILKKIFFERGIEAKEVDLSNSENLKKVNLAQDRIFYYGPEKNWWSRAGTPEQMPPGEPGGPDCEVFYEFLDVPHNLAFGSKCHPNCDCGRFLEIGNSVFMEYVKASDGTFKKLPKANVDFGGGLERLGAASQNDPDIFKVDLLYAIISKLEKLSGRVYDDGDKTYFRIIADHIRAICFMIADGVVPSNVERGYVARRLLRRALRYAELLGLQEEKLSLLAKEVAISYNGVYGELFENLSLIKELIILEGQKLKRALKEGRLRLEKLMAKASLKIISGKDAFDLYQSYGLPLDLILEMAKEKSFKVNIEEFELEKKRHQALSKSAVDKKFKGGLADTKEATIKLHTAHHLLLAALKQILGPEVKQRGSNITAERLRLDFSYPSKLTPEQLKAVEDLVNQKIKENLKVIKVQMPREEAEKIGAEREFGAKYGPIVSVYFIQDDKGNVFSKEFCAGPHVNFTSELGRFRIIKEESSGAGIRRIKAILE